MPTYALSFFLIVISPLIPSAASIEEKAKVVAAVWVTEFIQFLAMLFAPGCYEGND